METKNRAVPEGQSHDSAWPGWGKVTLCGLGVAATGFFLASWWLIVAPLFVMLALGVWREVLENSADDAHNCMQ